MAFRPIRAEEGRRHIRFEFDAERGVIRHQLRDGRRQEFQIEVKEERFNLRVVDDSASVDLESGR